MLGTGASDHAFVAAARTEPRDAAVVVTAAAVR